MYFAFFYNYYHVVCSESFKWHFIILWILSSTTSIWDRNSCQSYKMYVAQHSNEHPFLSC